MPKWPSREKIFGIACFLIGRAGRVCGFRIKRPFFIVGTGRCGTTLLLRILNSHRGISGYPVEANELWHPKLEPFESASLDIPPIEVDPKRFSDISIANWPPGHEERIRDIFTGFHLITGPSKVFFARSAMISFMIPKILHVFPESRFIHLYRFGPSVVESYFKKNFGKYTRHVFTEKDYRFCCARYWNDCILEIERKKNDLSLATKGALLELSYEKLCQNPRDVLDNIADFLGVALNGFKFDISKISSQNYKVADYAKNPEYAELLEVMSPGMKLKGYSPDDLSVLRY
jgi:hypothetical protein